MLGALTIPGAARAQVLAAGSIENLQQLSIEELANLQVTSVSKIPEALSDAPAAVYVITHDDIIRSGARRIPEILRLAPNLEVFQTSPENYVVTARGLSGNTAAQNFSNKVEVLIDGRTVYNPLFSGVYWDMMNVLPENIERIEVISGPSATLWGANAVNGVVNIITRNSGATQGGFLALSGGSFENRAAVQYGGRVGDDFAYRIYGQDFYERGFEMQNRQGAHDGWSTPDGGFRLDWTHPGDKVSLEGNISNGHEGQTGGPAQDFREKNLTASWQHDFSPTSTLQLLSYADQIMRYESGPHDGFTLTNYDFEGQYTFDVAGWNHILLGAGDRVTPYDLVPRIGTDNSLEWQPSSRTVNLLYGLVQDTISATNELNLILGIKLEDDPYYGLSPLPNLRLAWKPTPDLLIWAAVSHAIRAPTTFDADVREFSGSTLFLRGNPDFQPEKLNAFELGDRAQFGNASVSVSAFYNLYSDLRSIEITPKTITPLFWGNGIDGRVYGIETWGSYQAAAWWRLDAGLTLQHEHFGFVPGSSGLLGAAQVGDDPHTQARLRSAMDFGKISFDADIRYVGALPHPAVPAYVELDSRVAWHITPATEIALSGMNLLHAHHQEWTIPPSDEIPRMVSLELRQSF